MSIHLQNKDKESTVATPSAINRGTHYLADNPAYYEIQRGNTFMFYVRFPDNFFAGDNILSAQNAYAAKNAQEVLRISVNESSVPHFTMNAISLRRGNNEMKFAGVPTFGSGALVLDDFIGAGTKDVLLAWQRKAYNVMTEKVGLASDYKLDAWLTEYTPDYQVVRTWKIAGCWISGLSEGNYSHESTDKRAINATLEYDKAYPYVNDLA